MYTSCAGISADDNDEEDEEEVVITPANKKAVLAAQKAKLEAEKVGLMVIVLCVVEVPHPVL